MPSWTKKERRQYEHIKESSEKRGTPERRAKEIAGRTVNKGRRQRGETPSRRTQGTGNPNLALEERSKPELLNMAKELGISGRSRMNKGDLVKAIKRQRKKA